MIVEIDVCEILSNEEVTINDGSIISMLEITEFDIVTFDRN